MQSIIVYRNPLEAMFWESVTSKAFGVFMLAAVVFVVACVWIAGRLDKLEIKYRFIRKFYNWLLFVPASIAAGFVIYILY